MTLRVFWTAQNRTSTYPNLTEAEVNRFITELSELSQRWSGGIDMKIEVVA